MGLGLGGKCGMFFLVTLNILFLLLGLGLLIVGIIMKVDSDVLDKSEVTSVLNEVSFNNNLKLGNVANSLSILIICLGAFILIVAALGAFGACCKNRCMLVVYAIIVMLIFIIQIVAVALWFTMKNKVEDEVKGKLDEALKKYEGVSSTNEVSVGWDLIFIGFDCCGVDAVNSNNQNEFSETTWWSSRGSDFVPYSCCKSATEDNYKTGTETTCTQSTLTNVQEKGCYNAFKDFLKKYETAAIAIGIVLLIVELIAIIFAFLLCRAIGKQDMVV
ncbi:tetraspanin-18-like [Mercenaria mercenaria]|uniref:tetraspanin-18-like n=1 Tax=Mercenaria mercenaria TaxID=6596 RepID=UPI00234F16D2|nr:tetraspanin-18-like [Mercenaria mercenaria]XP_045208188.2 tetraspanin-18-like [Mercenaria mercenaria]XP_045208189.2 tetraspanin-18-like [Mercenaria mercenaria]XP_045208190.2 tetraspanin-18-like [Mercenaria mercenaria]XP_045208191.2 tetraspanin-18-like [Mercenaria mercenaria]